MPWRAVIPQSGGSGVISYNRVLAVEGCHTTERLVPLLEGCYTTERWQGRAVIPQSGGCGGLSIPQRGGSRGQSYNRVVVVQG